MENSAQQKSIKKNSFYSFINALTTLVLPVITFPYASRILHPEGIGKVNFVTAIEGYFAIIAGLGISAYATREAARLRDDRHALTKFCKEMIAINSLSMAVSYGLLCMAIIFIPKLESYRLMILIRSVNIFFTTIGLEWLYRAEEDFKYITLRSLIFKFSGLAYLFIFVRTQDDTIEYLIFGILTSVASNIYNLAHSRKYIDYRYKCRLELSRHLRPIFTFFGMSVIISVYTILDTSMIGFLSTETQVGYYSAATRLTKMTIGVLTSVTSVILPRLSYYRQTGEEKKFLSLAEKSLSINTLLALPMLVGLIFLARPLVLLFAGEAYIPAVTAMNIISPILFFISSTSIIGGQIFPAMRKEKRTLVSVTIGALTNITLNAVFIPRLGATGAAIGTTAAEFMVLVIDICFIRSLISKTYIINFMQALIGSGIEAGLIFFLSRIISHPIPLIAVSIVSSIAVYYLFLLIVRNKYIIEYTELFISRIRNKRKNTIIDQ